MRNFDKFQETSRRNEGEHGKVVGEYGDFNVASAVILEVHGEIAPKVVPAPEENLTRSHVPEGGIQGFFML